MNIHEERSKEISEARAHAGEAVDCPECGEVDDPAEHRQLGPLPVLPDGAVEGDVPAALVSSGMGRTAARC